MVVKGPAGGYTNARVSQSQTPSPFYKKQGTVAKLHKISADVSEFDEDSGLHTDESFDKHQAVRQATMMSRISQVSSHYDGKPDKLNGQRSRRIMEKKQTFERKQTNSQMKIKEVLKQAERNKGVDPHTQSQLLKQKTARDLVKEFVGFQPGKEFRPIKGKISQLMSQKELELEQAFLTHKLKSCSAFITRLLEKEFIKKQVIEGQQRARQQNAGGTAGATAILDNV